jgi:hypothetical protein
VKAVRQRFGSAPSECGLGILRKEKGPGWTSARPQRPGGPKRSGGLKRVDVP